MGAREATIKIISFNSIPSSWWNKAGRFYLEARAWQVGGARAQLVSLTNQKESERERREREGGGEREAVGYRVGVTTGHSCTAAGPQLLATSSAPDCLGLSLRLSSPLDILLFTYTAATSKSHTAHICRINVSALGFFSFFCVFLLLMRALSKPERATHQPTGPIYFKALVTFIDSVRGFQDRVYWLWHYGAQCRWKRLHLGGFRGKLYDTIYLA